MSWTKIQVVQVKMYVTFKLHTVSLLCNHYDLLHVSYINYRLFIACRS